MEASLVGSNSRTLLLTQGYEPIKTISWQRALTLFTLGKCEIVEEYDGFIRSSKLVLKMPAVVRLLYAFRRHKKPVKFTRINVHARDNYTCQYCAQKFPLSELTYDHVIPRAQGGTTHWGNITSSCSACNSKKAGRTPKQAGMKLLSEPKQPKWLAAIEIRLSQQSTPSEWWSYLYWNVTLSD